MFSDRSRYRAVPTVEARTPDGRAVAALKLRRLPAATGKTVAVKEGDRLDLLARSRLGDATAYWRIADANTELEARDLETPPGRAIVAPEA
jgi:nucleoid-associated protein YgaU